MYWSTKGLPLPITGDGSETRDWTYVDDIVNGLLAMGIKEEAVGEAINLGSGEEHRVIDMANMVNRLTGNDSGMVYIERRVSTPNVAVVSSKGNDSGMVYIERRNRDVKHRLLSSIDKAKRVLDYKPQVEFEDGLKKVHEWFDENRENISNSAEF